MCLTFCTVSVAGYTTRVSEILEELNAIIDEEEQDEEEDIEPLQMKFTSVPGALDTEDSANKSESEESSHPSQPSDDSRLIKKNPTSTQV